MVVSFVSDHRVLSMKFHHSDRKLFQSVDMGNKVLCGRLKHICDSHSLTFYRTVSHMVDNYHHNTGKITFKSTYTCRQYYYLPITGMFITIFYLFAFGFTKVRFPTLNLLAVKSTIT